LSLETSQQGLSCCLRPAHRARPRAASEAMTTTFASADLRRRGSILTVRKYTPEVLTGDSVILEQLALMAHDIL
jgi:hypothetical protein